jgi:hypothetical protein
VLKLAQAICSATDPDFRKQLPAGMGKAGMQPMSFLVYQIATIRLRQAAL